MLVGYALLQQGEHRAAREMLEPVGTELRSFGFPQWHAWALTLNAETYRLEGLLDVADTLATQGLEVATRAAYWYAVGFAERVKARIARDRQDADAARGAFDRAIETFERIGARFEAERTRRECAATPSAVEATRPSDAGRSRRTSKRPAATTRNGP
jgi:hypothetical protein